MVPKWFSWGMVPTCTGGRFPLVQGERCAIPAINFWIRIVFTWKLGITARALMEFQIKVTVYYLRALRSSILIM